MNRTQLNHPIFKSIPQSVFKFHHSSKSTISLPDSGTNSSLNPLYSFLPHAQNPSKIVDTICTNLKERRPALLERDMIPHLGTREISRVLLRSQSDPSAALTFFNWVKVDLGIAPTLRDYCLMLHILAWAQNFSQTMKLFSELIELNLSEPQEVNIFENLVNGTKDCSWDPVVFDMLLKSYLKSGLVHEGFITFMKMIKLGFPPKIISVNFLLNGLLKMNRIDECWGVYEEMGRIKLRGNTFTFNILTHVICKSGDVNKVNEFLEKMEEEGFDPDIITYNTLVDSHVKKGKLKDALYLYNIMHIRRVTPDLFTHTSLIKGFCKEGNMREAHKLFQQMVQLGLTPDEFSYNTLIHGYINKGMMQETRFLLHDMIKKGVRPNKFTCLMLIEGYRKKNMLISSVNLIVELQRFGVLVPIDVEVDLVLDLCRGDKPFAAKSLWERMDQEGKDAREFEIYNELIVSFCRLDHVTEALELKDEIFFKKMNPSLIVYRSIILCLCRLKRTIDGETLTKEMVEFGVRPDLMICRCLMNGFCEEKNLDKAELLLIFLGEELKVYDTECYNALFRVFCEEGEIDKLMEFQKKMWKIGFTPNGRSFKCVIDGLSRTVGEGASVVDSGTFESCADCLKYV